MITVTGDVLREAMLAAGGSMAASIVAKATMTAAFGLTGAWLARRSRGAIEVFFFFKQKTAYEIGVTSPVGGSGSSQPTKKRVISAATRRRMALGQRRRHAAEKKAATI
jgi:hypothetical protein